MKKRPSSDYRYWECLPDELRTLCVANLYGCSPEIFTEPAINYLESRIIDCDTFVSASKPYDLVRCIDTVIETCLFPIQTHEEYWWTYPEKIEKILNFSLELQNKYGGKKERVHFISPYTSPEINGKDAFRQKLNLYYCVLYSFTKNFPKLQEHLDILLKDSVSNVRQMLFFNNAEQYAKEDDWTKAYHFPGTDRFEIINWLAGREYIPVGEARKLLAFTYKKYAVYLFKLKKCYSQREACEHMHARAEKIFQSLAELVIEDINEFIDLFDEPDTEDLKQKTLLEAALQKSRERAAQSGESDFVCQMRVDPRFIEGSEEYDPFYDIPKEVFKEQINAMRAVKQAADEQEKNNDPD